MLASPVGSALGCKAGANLDCNSPGLRKSAASSASDKTSEFVDMAKSASTDSASSNWACIDSTNPRCWWSLSAIEGFSVLGRVWDEEERPSASELSFAAASERASNLLSLISALLASIAGVTLGVLISLARCCWPTQTFD